MLRELITQEEREIISGYIFDEIERQHYAPLDKILSCWENSKVDLFKLLGDNLIISKEIEHGESIENIVGDMDYLVDHPFQKEFLELMNSYYSKGDYETYRVLGSLINAYSLAINRVKRSFTFKLVHENGVIQVPDGAKPIRILSKIADAFNLHYFEDFRIKHSRILNTKKSKAELCLSIHPFDYMTLSDNDHGWESCVSWTEGGEYRAGTIEMMNSPCVVVAYLKTDREFCNWPSKKWRCLFIVNKDVIVSVREYPYTLPDVTRVCADWLKELAIKNLNWDFKDSVYKEELTREYKFRFTTNKMYNDASGYSYEHRGYVSNLPVNFHINYSGKSTCICCGNTNNSDVPDELMCYECSGYEYCYECGCRLKDYDEYYFDGNCFCVDCYTNLTTECDSCGEIVYSDWAKTIKIFHEDDRTELVHLCEQCLKDFNELVVEEKFTYNYSELSEEALKFLGIKFPI